MNSPAKPDQALRYLPFVIGTMVASVLGAFVIGGWWLANRFQNDSVRPTGMFVAKALNYSFDFPRGWSVNEKPAREWNASLLMKRAAPEATSLLSAIDNKTRLWSESELSIELLRRLDVLFQGLAHEPPAADKLNGRPAIKVLFQGLREQRLNSGLGFALQHQGVTYFLISWCDAATVAEAEPAIQQLLNGFAMLNGRPDWQPTTRTINGERLAYSLSDMADRWEKSRSPANAFDPMADIALEAMEPGSTTADKRGTVLIEILPVGKTSMDDVKARIIEREKETYPEIAVEPIAESTHTINESITLHGFRISAGPGRIRFLMAGLMNGANETVVFEAECAWSRKFFWEPEFVRLLKTWQPPKQE